MPIVLPTEPIPAVHDLTANNILIEGDYGIGKSGLLASTGYLLTDPEDKLRTYPCLRVGLSTWQEHKEFVEAVSKKPAGSFKGIGLDSLNVSYSHCLLWTMNNITFAGARLKHPSENPQLAYPRVTYEFITWLRSITLLGYHVIATCHVNIAEIRDKKGNVYNRWIPAFVGGSAESTYGQVLRIFSIVGFMTLEEILKPAIATKMGKAIPDLRADAARVDTEEKRVIHFKQSPNWLADNKHNAFPDTVELTDRWEEDWDILQGAWAKGAGAHEVADEEQDTAQLTAVPEHVKASLSK